MAIKEVPNLVSTSVNEPGYEFNGKIWTKSSGFVPWHEGVAYCVARNGKLQTLDDAVEFRHDSNGADSSKDYQHTGTLLAIDCNGLAHVYEPEPVHSLLVALRPEVQQRKLYFDVKADSELGEAILSYSKSTKRSFVVPSKDLVLPVSADAQKESEYSKNDTIRKLMPHNAQKNAVNIARAGFDSGEVWFARSALEKGYLRVRAVGLGDDGYINGLFAGNQFGNYGRARGVVPVGAQKISSSRITQK